MLARVKKYICKRRHSNITFETKEKAQILVDAHRSHAQTHSTYEVMRCPACHRYHSHREFTKAAKQFRKAMGIH
jgi:hypothetical protein